MSATQTFSWTAREDESRLAAEDDTTLLALRARPLGSEDGTMEDVVGVPGALPDELGL
jgi:hypothetical protein